MSVTTLSRFIHVSNFNISQHKLNFVLHFCSKGSEPYALFQVMLGLYWFYRNCTGKFPKYCVYSIFVFIQICLCHSLQVLWCVCYESRPQAVLQPEHATLRSEVPRHMPVCGWTQLTQLIFQHACACVSACTCMPLQLFHLSERLSFTRCDGCQCLQSQLWVRECVCRHILRVKSGHGCVLCPKSLLGRLGQVRGRGGFRVRDVMSWDGNYSAWAIRFPQTRPTELDGCRTADPSSCYRDPVKKTPKIQNESTHRRRADSH